jgi:prepilin-type N-terminal cleavage/methylation domain-containing protein
MNKHVRTSPLGFTLVEVIVAIFILVVGVLGILPMLALNVKSNTGSRHMGVANFLAQQKLERIKAWPYYDDQTIDGSIVYGITTGNTELFGAEDGSTLPRPVAENVGVGFKRSTSMIHNGSGGDYDCSSGQDGFQFKDGIGGTLGMSEGTFTNPADPTTQLTLNTGLVNKCASGKYAGEDFKIVLVRVQWADLFGSHELVRYLYVSRF